MTIQQGQPARARLLPAGLVGLAGFGFLITALAAPGAGGDSLRRTTSLFRGQDAAVALQALLMLPAVASLSRQAGLGALWTRTGFVAHAALALAALLVFPKATADMLYMAPQGVVGAWVFAVSNRGRLPTPVRWIGRIAGLGFMLIGIGFALYAGLVDPRILVRPLTDAEIDTQTWTTGNVVAHVCMAVGTVPGRLLYPVWCLLCWRAMRAAVAG